MAKLKNYIVVLNDEDGVYDCQAFRSNNPDFADYDHDRCSTNIDLKTLVLFLGIAEEDEFEDGETFDEWLGDNRGFVIREIKTIKTFK